MLTNRKDILFILKTSRNKTTGFYMMNNYVYNSSFIRGKYNVSFVLLNSFSLKNPFLNSLGNILNVIKYSGIIFYRLITLRPRLIYFTISPVNAFFRDLVYVFVIKIFKSKVVYHLHGKGIKEKYDRSNIYHFFYEWAYRNVYVIALSEKLKYDFEYLRINKYYIVPNAIPDYIKKNKIELKSVKNKNGVLKIVFLSNLILSKGILDFIDAIKLLSNETSKFQAYIIGNESEITASVINKKIEGYEEFIQFIGPLYNNKKLKFIQKCNLLVFPTYYKTETWGLVILEAMQLGLPVITTDEGATTDMIEDGVNGYIVNKKDPEDIKDKLLKFINQPSLIDEMGKINREKYLNKFSIDTFENNLSQVFDNLLKHNYE